MGDGYGKMLHKHMGELLEKKGIPLPEGGMKKFWGVWLDYEYASLMPAPEDFIYTVNFVSELPETAEKAGMASMEAVRIIDNRGKIFHRLKMGYHGCNVHVPCDFGYLNDLKDFNVPMDNLSWKVDFYPVLTTKSNIVMALAEAGALTVTETERGPLQGKKQAEIALNDDAFAELIQPLHYGYLGFSGAALIGSALSNKGECNEKSLRSIVGESEFAHLMRHFDMACGMTVRCVKIVEDSHGYALLPFKELEEAEIAYVESVYKNWGLDVPLTTKKMAMRDIGKALSCSLNNGIQFKEKVKNSRNLAHFLNHYPPMCAARERARIGRFDPASLLDAVEYGMVAAHNRRKLRREEKSNGDNGDSDDCENGNGE